MLLLVIVIITTVTIAINLVDNKINIESINKDWIIIDNSLENIKNNMDPITDPNEYFDWWELKDFNIDDETYKNALNYLVTDVRMCYLEHNHDSIYTRAVEFRKFRNKTEITSEVLMII